MDTKITLIPNGPLIVEGPIHLAKADGTVIETKGEKNGLCRCGHSANKPFCDGSHVKAGFKAE